jgi:hypothetical protein
VKVRIRESSLSWKFASDLRGVGVAGNPIAVRQVIGRSVEHRCVVSFQLMKESPQGSPIIQARPITATSLSTCVESSRCVLTFTSSDRSSGSVTRVGDAGEELLTQLFVALHFLQGPFDGRLSDVDARFEV